MPFSDIVDPLRLSLLVALTATFVVAIAGGALGRYLAVRDHVGKDFLDGLASLPLFLPPTVLGYYLTLLIGRNGPIGSLLDHAGIGLTFNWIGAAVASAIVAFPLMVRSARSAFEGIDPAIEECAALDGASRAERWRSIILPLARNGLTGGVVLAFGRAIGEFGATLMVSGNIPGRTQTLPLAIYDAFTVGDDRKAGILAALLTAVSLVVVILGLRLGRREKG